MQWSSGQPTESAPLADISEITVGRYVLNSIVGLVRNSSASLSWLIVNCRGLLAFEAALKVQAPSGTLLQVITVPKSTEPVEEAIGAVKKAVKITAGLQ